MMEPAASRPAPRPARSMPRLQALVERALRSSWLGGDLAAVDEETARRIRRGRRVQRSVRAVTFLVTTVANLLGILAVGSFILFVLPRPEGVGWVDSGLYVGGAYIVIALILGRILGAAVLERGPNGTGRWLAQGLEPTEAQRARALRGPTRLMWLQIALWTLGAVLLFAVVAVTSIELAIGVALTVLLGGITTSTAAYLMAELAFRPVIRRALAGATPDRRNTPGVARRLLSGWVFGTGAPLFGLLLVGILALVNGDVDGTSLAAVVVVLTALALLAGALVTMLLAYATVSPIASLHRAFRRVAEGELDTHVNITDTTELGVLQYGFNEMVAGLQERERVLDLFGRQVGFEAASRSIDGGIDLQGELRAVTVLFVDIVGSTQLAATKEPERVVELLNAFLTVVIDEVEASGGWINKFVGDAALAIYGAPEPLDHPADRCLAAARAIQRRLRAEVPELAAAIGVATGDAVAGNIGSEQRFEYTVIGDPVNEASRLTETAKSLPELVAASQITVDAAGADEAANWKAVKRVRLRGRKQATQVATPVL